MSNTTIAAQVAEQFPVTDGPPNAFAAEQSALELAGVPDGVMPVGSLIPNAELLDARGDATTLYNALGERPAVLVFYRGAWCPYCNIALRTYQSELLPELTGRGIALVAVSPQTPDGSLSMQEKNELSFAVLSDPGNKVAHSVGIVTAPSADARTAQLTHGLDLTKINSDGTIGLPMPTAIIVDAAHVVRWIDVHPNYATRSEPSQIVDALDALDLR